MASVLTNSADDFVAGRTLIPQDQTHPIFFFSNFGPLGFIMGVFFVIVAILALVDLYDWGLRTEDIPGGPKADKIWFFKLLIPIIISPVLIFGSVAKIAFPIGVFVWAYFVIEYFNRIRQRQRPKEASSADATKTKAFGFLKKGKV